ncbi:MAG TPA: hypothetical protein VMM36_17375, partial [Opitutaceae bacterium]|nr:hypothetical protein [Opitutaceae bacterium]
MKIPQTPPRLMDLFAEVQRSERSTHVFSMMRDQKTQRRYLHWDELRRLRAPEGITHREWWLVLKLSRTDALRPIGLLDSKKTPFQFAVTELVMEELHQIDFGAGGLVSIPEPITNP